MAKQNVSAALTLSSVKWSEKEDAALLAAAKALGDRDWEAVINHLQYGDALMAKMGKPKRSHAGSGSGSGLCSMFVACN